MNIPGNQDNTPEQLENVVWFCIRILGLLFAIGVGVFVFAVGISILRNL